jgi:hypothetical protein
MNLERLSVKLRQRSPWEAIDLGFAMAREWWREVYGVWIAVVIALSVMLWMLLPLQWAALSVWWLKPALDRVVLHVLASAVFGERPRWRTTLRRYPRYATNGLLGSLLWRRFSLARSFTLPVRQLENASGSNARTRLTQLRRRSGSQAVLLTIACLHFEAVAMISLLGLYVLMVPNGMEDLSEAFDWYRPFSDTARYIGTGLWLAAMTMIEPLYVAAGFALYLNRRTVLEGWDLEVQLRGLSEQGVPRTEPRAPAPAPTPPAHTTAGLLLVFGAAVTTLMSLPQPAYAEPPTVSEVQSQAKEVLKDPLFGTYERRLRIERLHREPAQKAEPADLSGLAAIMQAAAQILRVAVWVALAIAVLYAAYWLFSNVQLPGRASSPPARPPDLLFGLDVRPESLPEDLAGAARALIGRGEIVAALSLLYRGALVSLLHREGIDLSGGDTESDCLAKVQPRVPPLTHQYLSRLVGCWQGAAYAHRTPLSAEVEALAEQWRDVFGKAVKGEE